VLIEIALGLAAIAAPRGGIHEYLHASNSSLTIKIS